MLKYYKRKSNNIFEIKICKNEYHSKASHAHDEISLTYILKGKTYVDFKGKREVFTQGDCIIIPDGVFHNCNPKDFNNWEFILIYIKKNWFYEQTE